MLFHCWAKWHQYMEMMHNMRDIVNYWRITCDQKCFCAWKQYVLQCKQAKEAILRKFILRMKNAELASIYLTWVHWVQKRKKTKRFCRRLFKCPQFELWLDYVAMNKLRRVWSNAAVVVQALVRGVIARRDYTHVRKCIRRIEHFTHMVLAKRLTKQMRAVAFEAGFAVWKPMESTKLQDKATDTERRRLVRQQQCIQEAELKAVSELKKHLKSHSGFLQLTEMGLDIKEGLYSPSVGTTPHLSEQDTGKRQTMSAADALRDLATKELLKRCKHMSRAMEKHEFLVKTPPFIKCADPRCAAVFTNADQYHMHVSKSSIHNKERCLLPKWLLRTMNSSNVLNDSRDNVLDYVGLSPSSSQMVQASDNNPRKASQKSGKAQKSQKSQKSQKAPMQRTLSRQDSAASDIISSNLQLFSYLHMQLRHREGSKLLRNYLARVYGEDEHGDDNEHDPQPSLVHCFDCYNAIQELRKTSFHVENIFTTRVFSIVDTFLSPGCQKPLPVDCALELIDVPDPKKEPSQNDAVGRSSSKDAAPGIRDARQNSSFIRSIRSIRDISSRMSAAVIGVVVPPAAATSGKNKGRVSMLDPIGTALSGAMQLSVKAVSRPATRLSELETSHDERSDFSIAEDKAAAESVIIAFRRISQIRDTMQQQEQHHVHHHAKVAGSFSRYVPTQARHSFWRRLMRMEPERYERWTDEHSIPPDIFDVIEWFCFRRMFSAVVCDFSYTRSSEYHDFLAQVAADEVNREKALRMDYAHSQKLDRQRWTSQFKFVEMAISRKSDDIINMFLIPREMQAIMISYIKEISEQIVTQQSAEEQEKLEGKKMVIDDAVDWVLFNVTEELYDNYAHILIQQMWDQPELRKVLLTFIGVVDEKYKKKLFVNMEVSKRKQKAAFEEFMAANLTSYSSASSADKDAKDTISALL
jgi:uncharacterized C2H2 Zn-finger protein